MSVIYWILDKVVFNLHVWKIFFEAFVWGILIGMVGFPAYVIVYWIRYKELPDFPEHNPVDGNCPEDHAG